ncbi:MAG: chromosomal replication initiator protein DnaA [Verrucomicrobiales bacterium]|nr:chromosomal replication initiator protein DnaA [Verrucomicrobiales bacterium]|tara:strand:+ start:1220 stop:2605 length:1386 start_codon:yes stop_codon:yes gene_type:complete
MDKVLAANQLPNRAAAEKVWRSSQKRLKEVLSSDVFELWFKPVKAVGMDEAAFTLEVANEFCEVWLADNYSDLVRTAVAEATGRELRIVFRSLGGPSEDSRKAAEESEKKGDKPKAKPTSKADELFNPRYNFDTFVVGNNEFAHRAALAVAQNPGKSYNPLFLFGGVGLGKTHLLHAIGHQVLAQKPNARVAYVSCEKFTNEFIDAIQNNSLVQFRRKYRHTDVLLIDDVQFLAGKERIQEEFFHTFNALHESHKQIVLTCDRPAGEIAGLEDRLVSRFVWGLVTDLQPPDIETRLAILQKKATAMDVELPDQISNFLAQRVRNNIRRLEGALIRIISYSSLTGKPLTQAIVENLLRDVLDEESQQAVSIEMIQKKVAEHFDIRLADMTSKRRPEHIAFPRQIAMYLARQLTGNSLNSIGEAFGGRDHGTVLHACRLVKDRMEIDGGVRQTVGMLERKLRS